MAKITSGYQEILDQTILYKIIEKTGSPILSSWIEAMCMFKPPFKNLEAIAN
jgi:hypothetical protein